MFQLFIKLEGPGCTWFGVAGRAWLEGPGHTWLVAPCCDWSSWFLTASAWQAVSLCFSDILSYFISTSKCFYKPSNVSNHVQLLREQNNQKCQSPFQYSILQDATGVMCMVYISIDPLYICSFLCSTFTFIIITVYYVHVNNNCGLADAWSLPIFHLKRLMFCLDTKCTWTSGYRCLAIMFGTFITTIVNTQCWLVQGLTQCLQICKTVVLDVAWLSSHDHDCHGID